VTLAFRKAALKDAGFTHRESGLLVQALKALGRERVDATVIAHLRAWLPTKQRGAVLRDTRATTGWIYQFIKQVCAEEEG
jgi:hypothetical protein